MVFQYRFPHVWSGVSPQILMVSLYWGHWTPFILATQMTAINRSCSVVPQHHCTHSPSSIPPFLFFTDMTIIPRPSLSTSETIIFLFLSLSAFLCCHSSTHSGSIHTQNSILSFWNSISLCVCSTFSIDSLITGHLNCLHSGAIVSSTAVHTWL